MDAAYLFGSLEKTPGALSGLLEGLSIADVRWKPSDKDWSIVEIVCHLADEETEDFGSRLRSVLEDPSREWPPIDPERWAAERRYNEHDPGESLGRFSKLRQDSLVWLRGLQTPDWSRAHPHPRLGALRAGDLLASWAAHDLLHLRQVLRRLHQLAARRAKPFGCEYAGSW